MSGTVDEKKSLTRIVHTTDRPAREFNRVTLLKEKRVEYIQLEPSVRVVEQPAYFYQRPAVGEFYVKKSLILTKFVA